MTAKRPRRNPWDGMRESYERRIEKAVKCGYILRDSESQFSKLAHKICDGDMTSVEDFGQASIEYHSHLKNATINFPDSAFIKGKYEEFMSTYAFAVEHAKKRDSSRSFIVFS